MLDHLSIQCADVAVSAAFYDKVLAPLGGLRLMDFGVVIGFGVEPKPDFWLGAREPRVWPEYHPGYYGAFVRDPDGNNVEAVCHVPE
jgi:catechol 2,3-dioxygenase-like lactoylglutathione lyase family enzyme